MTDEAEALAETLSLADALALDRTLLALERTLLAWIRFAVALVLAGITAWVLSPELWVRGVGTSLIAAGAVTAVGAVWRLRRLRWRVVRRTARRVAGLAMR